MWTLRASGRAENGQPRASRKAGRPALGACPRPCPPAVRTAGPGGATGIGVRSEGGNRLGSAAMRVSAPRTLVLIPVAIALNIALGSTVQQALKLPIYLDSVGTVITGVLAGPLAGLVTGVLTNLIWAYVLPPPLAAPTAGPFAVTAAVIGLLAGLWGRLGLFRSRRAAEAPLLLGAVGVAVAVVIVVAYTFSRAYASTSAFKSITGGGSEAFGPSEIAFGVVVLAFVGLAARALFVRRGAGGRAALGAAPVARVGAAGGSAPAAPRA